MLYDYGLLEAEVKGMSKPVGKSQKELRNFITKERGVRATATKNSHPPDSARTSDVHTVWLLIDDPTTQG